MVHYPLEFRVRAESAPGVDPVWHSESLHSKKASPTAIPPEFGGLGGGFSPEDYFALALLNCYLATFKVLAKNSNVQYRSITTEGKLIVDRNDEGFPVMKEFFLKAEITGAEQADKTKRIAEKTSQSCLIHRSVKTKINYEILIT